MGCLRGRSVGPGLHAKPLLTGGRRGAGDCHLYAASCAAPTTACAASSGALRRFQPFGGWESLDAESAGVGRSVDAIDAEASSSESEDEADSV